MNRKNMKRLEWGRALTCGYDWGREEKMLYFDCFAGVEDACNGYSVLTASYKYFRKRISPSTFNPAGRNSISQGCKHERTS